MHTPDRSAGTSVDHNRLFQSDPIGIVLAQRDGHMLEQAILIGILRLLIALRDNLPDLFLGGRMLGVSFYAFPISRKIEHILRF